MDALDPQGPIAAIQDRAWQILLPATVVIFVVVALAMVWLLARYRRRGPADEDIPAQVAGNNKVVAAWLIVTVVFLGVIKVSTYAVAGEAVRYPASADAVNVRVVAKQYWFEFEYTDREARGVVTANELHIPTGQEVALVMESLAADLPDQGAGGNEGDVRDGVIHSFWVPKLAGKIDIIPGHTRELTIVADAPGTYHGHCAEFCGLSHANMRFVVVAHEPGDFEAWLEDQWQEADIDGLDGVAALGAELFETHACIDCHAIRGYETAEGFPADVRIAPNLTHFNSRSVFAGGIFDVDDDAQLRAWLENPPAEKPGAQMPNLDIPERDIRALIEFLRTLD